MVLTKTSDVLERRSDPIMPWHRPREGGAGTGPRGGRQVHVLPEAAPAHPNGVLMAVVLWGLFVISCGELMKGHGNHVIFKSPELTAF